MTVPSVDVIVAVHSATRPVHRAVASVLRDPTADARVLVVAHNIDPAVIRENLAELADHPRVELLALRDGIPSPAGPMNHGFDSARARYVSLLGSDDELAPGALTSWLALARAEGASAVIPRIEIVGRASQPLPPTRNGSRLRRLNARRDRLAYRTAPLGLIDRRAHPDLRFTTGVRSGEDIAFSAQLWFTGIHIAIDRSGPAYLVHEDAEDRVTAARRAVDEDFAFLDAVDGAEWFTALSEADRTALVVKILRIHLLDAVTSRVLSPAGLTDEDRAGIERVRARLDRMAPKSLRLLSRVDHRILDAARAPAPDAAHISVLAHDRWNQRSFGALLTPAPQYSLHPQAMYRVMRAANRSAARS